MKINYLCNHNLIKLLFLIYFTLFSITLISYAQESERFPRIGFIKSDRTNIRAGDNLNFEVLCQVSKGEAIKVIERRYKWYKVLLPKSACAFVKKEYVSSDNGIGIVNANNVNVRAKPGLNSTIIGQLNKEEKIKIKEEIEGWYKIEPSKNFTGWVHSDLITFKPLEIKKEEPKKEEKLKEGLEEEKVEEETVQLEIAEPQVLFEAKGKLLGTGRLINRPGTHKLMLNSKDFCYLKSEKVDLNKFINLNVEVRGKLIEYKNDKPYVISVETVEITKKGL